MTNTELNQKYQALKKQLLYNSSLLSADELKRATEKLNQQYLEELGKLLNL